MKIQLQPNDPNERGEIWCTICGEMVSAPGGTNEYGEGARRHRQRLHPEWGPAGWVEPETRADFETLAGGDLNE